MSFFPCLSASNPKNMTNLKRKNMKNMVFLPCLVASTPEKMTNWNRKSPRMISLIMKRLMKTFQVKCLILMIKRLIMLISVI
jgi:hypothetical protein